MNNLIVKNKKKTKRNSKMKDRRCWVKGLVITGTGILLVSAIIGTILLKGYKYVTDTENA